MVLTVSERLSKVENLDHYLLLKESSYKRTRQHFALTLGGEDAGGWSFIGLSLTWISNCQYLKGDRGSLKVSMPNLEGNKDAGIPLKAKLI